MVAIYVRRIRDGKMKIEDVPARWRDAVIAAMGELNVEDE